MWADVDCQVSLMGHIATRKSNRCLAFAILRMTSHAYM
jgi:hypothetical protein